MAEPGRSDIDRRVALAKFMFEAYSREIAPVEEEWDPDAPQLRALADSQTLRDLDAYLQLWMVQTDAAIRRARARMAAQRQ